MKAWTSTRASSWWLASPPSLWPSAAGAARMSRRHSGATRYAARLGTLGDAVAVARGLAGEEQPPAGPQHAAELAEGAVEVGQVVQHGVAEDEVEGVVLERQLLGVAGDGADVEVRGARALACSASSIPGEMSVHTASPTKPACSMLRLK